MWQTMEPLNSSFTATQTEYWVLATLCHQSQGRGLNRHTGKSNSSVDLQKCQNKNNSENGELSKKVLIGWGTYPSRCWGTSSSTPSTCPPCSSQDSQPHMHSRTVRTFNTNCFIMDLKAVGEVLPTLKSFRTLGTIVTWNDVAHFEVVTQTWQKTEIRASSTY